LGSIGITNLYRRKSVSLYFYCIIEFQIYLLKQKKNNLGKRMFLVFFKMYNYLLIFVNCFLQLGSGNVFVISNWLFYNYQLEIGPIGSLYIYIYIKKKLFVCVFKWEEYMPFRQRVWVPPIVKHYFSQRCIKWCIKIFIVVVRVAVTNEWFVSNRLFFFLSFPPFFSLFSLWQSTTK
jgi:hypothetical protein